MAFPTSPVNGQIYGDYKFDTSIGVWKKNYVQRTEGSLGLLHLFEYNSSDTLYSRELVLTANGQTFTCDFSEVLPANTKAVHISAFIHAHRTTSAVYSATRVHFSDTSTFTAFWKRNTLKVDAIGYMAATGFIGGTISGPVNLDSNKYFYAKVEGYHMLSSGTCYVALIGYYT